MAIDIKSVDAIEKMRIAGRLAAQVLDMITPYVKSGVSTDELDKICHDYIVNVQNAIPAPLNYHGFPKSICTSINNVVCHGIPGEKKLKKEILSMSILRLSKTIIMVIPPRCYRWQIQRQSTTHLPYCTRMLVYWHSKSQTWHSLRRDW
ncbi:Methionine aminopeptidase (EC [uncultured Gammaproteobacteria bacterium]|nr:Methionine aminopeptidase (EC [uncultured Gammaproteobacteria bacterium]